MVKSDVFLQTMVKKEFDLSLWPWLMFTSISIDVLPVLFTKPSTWMFSSELIGSKNSNDCTDPVTKVKGLLRLKDPKQCL